MIEVGKMNDLIVARQEDSGYILRDNFSDDEAYLETHSKLQIEDRVEVFVYLDSSNSLIATLETPIAMVGEYGLMRAVENIRGGTFFSWGIEKDLFVPDTEQRDYIRTGEWCVLRVCRDPRTEKVYGTAKVGKYIKDSEFDINPGDSVEIIPATKERLGYRSIINKKYVGMIYHNEIFQRINLGEPITGVVKKLREDGLVDAALQVQGFKNLVSSKDTILNYLKKVGGNSPLNDKSSPDEIKKALGMSKQTFKKTIGMLYREKKIVISKDGIALT